MQSDESPIPLCVPHIRGREWDYIKECLDTGWVSSVGSYVERFEREFANFVGTGFAVACANGTAALHTALICLGVQPGDVVLVSDLTFIASANAIRYVGATPIFIDAGDSDWQMCPRALEQFLTEECEVRDGATFVRSTGQRVSAVMPVHILGTPVDMEAVMALASRFNLNVVEDATESLGASFQGKPAGSIGHISAFSFNGNKIMTTGGGGMLCTSDETIAQRAKHLTTQAKEDPIEFIHDEVGFNYRLTNIQAAMGVAQLEELPSFLARKVEIYDLYCQLLDGLPLEPMPIPANRESAKWLFTVRHRDHSSRPLMRELASHGIQTRPLWQPMHLSPAMSDLNPSPCPVSRQLYLECLSLPCSVGITDGEIERVARHVHLALS